MPMMHSRLHRSPAPAAILALASCALATCALVSCGEAESPVAGDAGTASEVSCEVSCGVSAGALVERAEACGMDRPSLEGPPPASGCQSDAECEEGVGPRCTRAHSAGVCTAHECLTSDDCGAGEVCACGVGPLAQNRCLEDRCAGGECFVAHGCGGPEGVLNGPFAAASRTEADACRTDADCEEGAERCTFADGRWACVGACSD